MKTTIASGIALWALLSLPADAGQRLAVSYGFSHDGSHTQRIGVASDLRHTWLESSRGYLGAQWEVSLTRLDGGKDLYALAVAPVLQYWWHTGSDTLKPYLELGVGAAYLSDTRYLDRELSTRLQFEDRLGIGIRLKGGHDINLRFLHYSNASIKKPNDGINQYLLSYGLRF